jgi:hypothetical protein
MYSKITKKARAFSLLDYTGFAIKHGVLRTRAHGCMLQFRRVK